MSDSKTGEIKDQVRTFILSHFLFTDDSTQLADNASFLDEGIVDSTGMMEVIFFLEDHFKIKIDDSEMVPEHLDSINHIEVFVQRKLK
ncbi:MAG: acyl carrier protein [Pseudomonadota bacterium]